MVRRFLHWYADLPVTLIATSSLMLGLAFSSAEAEGTITWGHEMLLVTAVPVVAWAVMRWWLGR